MTPLTVGSSARDAGAFYRRILNGQAVTTGATRLWLSRAGMFNGKEPGGIRATQNVYNRALINAGIKAAGLGDIDWGDVLQTGLTVGGSVASSILGKGSGTSAATAAAAKPAASSMPSWLLPVGLVAGVGGLVLLLRRPARS